MALNASGPVEGVFVIPGLRVNVPVGSAGVPPQVQVVAACAEDAPPAAHARQAAAATMAPIMAAGRSSGWFGTGSSQRAR